MTSDPSTISAPEQVLQATAHRIAEHGTRSESAVLEALAGAAHERCPAAAAALVDWEGPEVARLRAYGLVHGALLRECAAIDRQETATQVVAASTVVAA